MILWSICQRRGLTHLHHSIPTRKVEGITREEVGSFLGLGCHRENEKAWRGREFQMRRFEREESDYRKNEREAGFCREKRWKLES